MWNFIQCVKNNTKIGSLFIANAFQNSLHKYSTIYYITVNVLQIFQIYYSYFIFVFLYNGAPIKIKKITI